MTSTIRAFAAIFCGIALLWVGCDSGRSHPRSSRGVEPTIGSSDYPRRPIKVIVPFAAGGGSDTFGRILVRAIEEQKQLPQRMVILNVPGAGGTIGSRRVKNARPDGYTLLLLHEGMMTAKRSGQASYGREAFTPLAGTGDATQVLAVANDSPFRDLGSLMAAAADSPDSIVFSANMGAPSHFSGLMLEAEKSGSKFRYTQTGGGSKRFAALQGGHVDVSVFSIAEFSQFQKAGMRALALLGPQRHPEIPNVPTAVEQGFDVISQNMQFWWAPKGTPNDRIEKIADALITAMKSPVVRQQLAAMKVDAISLRGNALAAELKRRGDRVTAVAPSQNPSLPNFPWIVLTIVLGLAVLATFRARSRQNAHAKDEQPQTLGSESAERPTPADLPSTRWPAINTPSCSLGLFTVAYVISLQTGWFGFVPSTAIYALALGGTFAREHIVHHPQSFIRITVTLLLVAATMSLGMHYLFTQILVVDLP